MSRFKRRSLAAIVGLSLGWFAAGMTFPTAHAEGEAGHAMIVANDEVAPAKPAADGPHADKLAPAKAEHAAKANVTPPHETSGESAEGGFAAARMIQTATEEAGEGKIASSIVPSSEQQIAWFKPVLGAIVGLFVAAGLLGWLAAAAKGPPAPEPADDHAHDAKHDAKHDAGHGHDAHSAGHSH